MNTAVLPAEAQEYIKNLEEKYQQAAAENKTWQIKYNALEAEYRLALFRKFGRSSERFDPNQQSLFDEQETPEAPAPPEETTEAIKSYSRKRPGRKPLDPKLPRKEIVIDIPDEEKTCNCGEKLTKIGEEVSEKLQVIPPQIWVERTIRPKYACKACEGAGDEERPAVRVAPAPPAIIPHGIASASLLAFLLVNKYVDHLPFYRQEKQFERIGAQISRQNMSNWQRQVYEKLKYLFMLMKAHSKTGPVMRMDETTVQVMGEEGRSNTQKSYMWLARGGPPDTPVVLYQYRQTRGSKHIHEFLEGFEGYLQTDGYKAYVTAVKDHPKVTLVGCFAHARRKFFEAAQVTKKTGSAEEGLKYIQKLYSIERALRLRDLDDDAFILERKKQVLPVLAKFKKWLEKKAVHTPPGVDLGKAVHYTLNQWDLLIAYLDSPFLTPDNNASENAIRPFVLGRRNWLFSGSPRGAESSCGMYSLIETAKVNGLEPFKYLYHLFCKAPLAKTKEDWSALLPWNCKLEITDQ